MSIWQIGHLTLNGGSIVRKLPSGNENILKFLFNLVSFSFPFVYIFSLCSSKFSFKFLKIKLTTWKLLYKIDNDTLHCRLFPKYCVIVIRVDYCFISTLFSTILHYSPLFYTNFWWILSDFFFSIKIKSPWPRRCRFLIFSRIYMCVIVSHPLTKSKMIMTRNSGSTLP